VGKVVDAESGTVANCEWLDKVGMVVLYCSNLAGKNEKEGQE
jgi:hypothetical protein